MWWESLITVVTAFGGIEVVKYIANRKSNSRIAEAEADGAEFQTIQTTVEFLQRQLQEKEERFANQTDRLRVTQDDLFKERELRHAAELELAMQRCDDHECPYRQPPNAHTPPKPGITRDKFFEKRLQQCKPNTL